jgi:phosphate transport system protein
VTRIQRRLEQDLEDIRRRVGSVGARVDDAVGMAVHALLTGNRALAAETVLNDLPINRVVRELDAQCHVFVARHLPSAGHLRFVSSVLRLNIILERVGDYAVTIARETEQLGEPPPPQVATTMQQMADQSRKMYRQAMEAWVDRNAEMARGTKLMASGVDLLLDNAWATMLALDKTEAAPSLRRSFAYLIVFNNLERVSDQAKNICEEALFAATGETKPPKQYKVLFIDEEHGLSALAEAMAERAFPQSGKYSSAGWAPIQRDGVLDEYMDLRGLTPREPTRLEHFRLDLSKQHVLVGLSGDVRPHIDAVPFSTVVLEWSLPTDLGEAQVVLSDEIRRLMEKLRGEGAR